MPTTIQVDRKIKKKLFELKLILSEKKRKNFTYNDVIKVLLDKRDVNTKNHDKYVKIRELKGILSKSDLDEYYKEKHYFLEKEEIIHSISMD